MKIVTLTMNPAVDKSSRVDTVTADRKLRCETPQYEPGGGGINVARAVKNLGGSALAVYPAGAVQGELFRDLMEKENLDHRAIAVSQATRVNLMIYENTTGRQFRFGMPGPKLSRSEWENCLSEVTGAADAGDYLVASGSLPPGVPEDFFDCLARTCREKEIRLLVDTSGQALCRAARSRVFLLTPNRNELETLAGCEMEDEAHQEETIRSLVDQGAARYIVLTLGAAGVVAVSKKGVTRVRAPTVKIKSKVGAGDSTLAGIVFQLSKGAGFLEAVRYGVAAGAAAVMTPGSRLCRKADVDKLVQTMEAY